MDGIEFDLLDPCCQKEVLNERKKKEITNKLRYYDRSNTRLDMCFTVFKSDTGLNRCSCCPESSYAELATLKAMAQQQQQQQHETELDINAKQNESDDEFDLDEDDFVSAFELERREEMKQKIESVMRMQKLGFGVHVEDSIAHLETYISCGLPIVLHIYSNTKTDALLDLHLENMSMRYLGTLFRRIPLSNTSLRQFAEKYGFYEKGNSSSSFLSSGGSTCGLVVFYNRVVTCSTFCLHDFVSNTAVYEEDLCRFLEAGHALQFEPDQDSLSLLHYTVNAADVPDLNGAAAEGEKEESFCDEPQCGRKFPHAHVGNGRGITGPKSSSGDESSDVFFTKKYFTQI